MIPVAKAALALAAAAALSGGALVHATWPGVPASAASDRKEVGAIAVLSRGAPLSPGRSTAVTVTIADNESFPIVVTAISAGSSNALAGVSAGTVTTAALARPAATVIQPGHKGTYTLTATMILNAATAAQGKAFTIPLTADLAQVTGQR